MFQEYLTGFVFVGQTNLFHGVWLIM